MTKKIDFEVRKKIEELINLEFNPTQIIKKLDLCPSTYFRDIKKCKGKYNANEAENNTSKGFHPIDFDIIGKKYGLLTIKKYLGIKDHRTWWECLCDCGQTTIISRKKLGDYNSPKRPLSCGCNPKQKGRYHNTPIEESALRKYLDLLKFREIQGRCWNWTGYCMNGRTPMCQWNNKVMTVRKCMHLIMNGILYESEKTHAKCRNILCFNPEHIALGPPPSYKWYE